MGQILLVRHGQASWGADDYDVLSPTGERQAGVVGEAWRSVRPDRVLHGSMRRQQHTAELATAAAGWAPMPETDAGWNEMDHLAVLGAQPHGLDREPDRAEFQQWFETASMRWTSGDHDGDYDEPFSHFRDRVRASLEALAADGTVVVFTSGGPIAVVTSWLLGGDATTYARLAPVVVNTSVTRIVSGRRGLTLLAFNEHAHLADDLLTYR